MTPCPKCNGPMVPLLTSMVCGRDCEKPVLMAEAAPCSEDVQRLRDALSTGVLHIPAGYDLTYCERAEAYVVRREPEYGTIRDSRGRVIGRTRRL